MKGLFVKDVQLLCSQKKTIFMLLALSVFLTLEMDASYFISYLTFGCAFLAIASPAYDEADNGYPFLFTLPIQRKTYVAEKYIFAFCMTGGVCLATSMLSLGFYTARGQMDICLPEILRAAAIFPGMLLFISLVYPLVLKFGPEQGRIIMAGLLIGVMAICFFALRVMVAEEIDIRALAWVEWFTKHPLWADLGLFAGVLPVYAVSACISVRIMDKKEF